ncbi:tyrosine-type recombinase/integrase [Desulfofundulus salinus]
MRAVQKGGRVRDIAIVTLLLHAGLRVSEVCALTLDDIVLGERIGKVIIRLREGGKRREVPLNANSEKGNKGLARG